MTFVGRFGIVGIPDRRGDGGGCLLPRFFGENRCAISALGKKNAAGQTGNAPTDNCHAMLHQNDLRAMIRCVI